MHVQACIVSCTVRDTWAGVTRIECPWNEVVDLCTVGRDFVLDCHPAWDHFPTEDLEPKGQKTNYTKKNVTQITNECLR